MLTPIIYYCVYIYIILTSIIYILLYIYIYIIIIIIKGERQTLLSQSDATLKLQLIILFHILKPPEDVHVVGPKHVTANLCNKTKS